jgi:hypothetical protein
MMLNELQRLNYAPSTVRCYIHAVEDFSKYFHRSSERLGPRHIREYQVHLFRDRKLSLGTIQKWLVKSEGPDGPSPQLEFSAKGARLMEVDRGGSFLWDTADSHVACPIGRRQIPNSGYYVNRARLSPDLNGGFALITVTEFLVPMVALWDLAHCKEISTLYSGNELTEAYFSPDGRRAFVHLHETGTNSSI